MSLKKIIPTIFYEDIETGIELFVDGLGFKSVYENTDGELFQILERDGVTLIISENQEFAKESRPEIRIDTDDIESIYEEVVSRKPALLHPNSNKIALKPWGLKEFALADKSSVCVIIQCKAGKVKASDRA